MPGEGYTPPQVRAPTHDGRPRTYGLRFSFTDAAVLLVAGFAIAALLMAGVADMALLVGYTVGHFFLFCNVFRVRRAPELIWATVFLGNAGLSLAAGFYPFAWACALQLLLTAVLLYRETRQQWYHGIFAHHLNPHLDAYLRGEV